MRIVLIIFLVLLLIVGILCMVSVSLSLKWWNGSLKWNVRVCGIRLLPRKKRKINRNKKKEKAPVNPEPGDKEAKTSAAKEASSGNEPPEEEHGDFFMDRLWKLLQKIAGYGDIAGSVLFSMPKPLRTMGKSFTLSHIRTDIVIADEDASECALRYAGLQSLVQIVLSKAGQVINVGRRNVKIGYDFTADESIWNVDFRLKFRLGPAIAAGIYFLIHFFRDVRKAKKAVISKKI